MPSLSRRTMLSILCALVAGTALRLWFIHAFPQIQGDTLLYGDIARNWLTHGIYGRSLTQPGGPTAIIPTLVRLPGYPAFLALSFAAFGTQNYFAVLYLQVVIDLATCLLIAGFVARICGPRAAMAALWLAMLCPFTANYVAMPLTETPSIFCVALGLYAFAAVLDRPSWKWILVLAFALSYAALLRPDGALLAVALLPALIVYGRYPQSLRIALICGMLSLLPFTAWTLRNWHTFHVFEPLAPRYANDPGEFASPGFIRWVKTFTADFTTTTEIYWSGNSDRIDLVNLPSRSIDNPNQYHETEKLLQDYNATTTLTPELDARFAQLAQQRIDLHPLRYYLTLPLLRLADMWLRPRTETTNAQLRWWQYSRHPKETWLAIFYGLLNLAYLIAAFLGALRRPRLIGAMLGLLLLRSLLLATLEAPESRYTLESFPLVIVLAAVYLRTVVVPGAALIWKTPAARGTL
jgi:Dolichyl-phosphate-mannose-protein mannosyltransferase